MRVLIAVVVLGFAGVGARIEMAAAKTVTVSAMSGMKDEGGCNGCGGDQGVSLASCLGICGSMVAILPAMVPYVAAAIEPAEAAASAPLTGTRPAPEPHPPRPTILS